MCLPVSGKKLLVHCCCCHCAAYTLQSFRQQNDDVTAFWYNPNIHPYREHRARSESLVALTRHFNFPLVSFEGYDMTAYFQQINGRENRRCLYCYEIRLTKTADEALARGFEAFSSSLLISPWQKHDFIRETGEKIARDKGIPFLYADLRQHYAESRRITKPLNLYRQQYCGCLFSEWERYGEGKKDTLFNSHESQNSLRV
jgi:predicted adenine nucleotide alpha hydrolase (AANH) superfamily ATPase